MFRNTLSSSHAMFTMLPLTRIDTLKHSSTFRNTPTSPKVDFFTRLPRAQNEIAMTQNESVHASNRQISRVLCPDRSEFEYIFYLINLYLTLFNFFSIRIQNLENLCSSCVFNFLSIRIQNLENLCSSCVYTSLQTLPLLRDVPEFM